MKPRHQSQHFPEHMSEYYKDKELNQATLQIVSEDTSDSVFHKKVFSICDVMGNFSQGFILVHFQGYIYLVDQHAASEKSLFLQYMINPVQKYSVDVDYTTSIPNYLRPVLEEKRSAITHEGWQFQQLKRKALETDVKLTKAPLVYNKELQEEDFSFLVQKLFAQKVDQDTSYSENQRNAMATYACRNAYKVGDRLRASQMRGLLDSLYKMDAPFNCPHGRPTIASLGRVVPAKRAIAFHKQYQL